MTFSIFDGFGHVMEEVALALLPLIILFFIFQLFFLRLPPRKIVDVIKGMILTFLGLSVFLQGVHVGFMPAGQEIGAILGGLSYNWVLIPIGFAIGFVAVFAEPAVRVLTDQIEKVSSGYIPSKVMLYTLSIGVAFSVGLAMCRILYGISLWWILIPGYVLAFLMSRFTSKTFTSVAFDSGGVATGPMTATFILAMAVGVADALEGRDPLIEGFGLVSLVALAPILSVLTLGVLYSKGEKQNERMQQAESVEL
jgi:hypothetical protein